MQSLHAVLSEIVLLYGLICFLGWTKYLTEYLKCPRAFVKQCFSDGVTWGKWLEGLKHWRWLLLNSMWLIILQHIYFESETEDVRLTRRDTIWQPTEACSTPCAAFLGHWTYGRWMVSWDMYICTRVCMCVCACLPGLTMRNAFVMPARPSRHKSPFFLIEAHRVMW